MSTTFSKQYAQKTMQKRTLYKMVVFRKVVFLPIFSFFKVIFVGNLMWVLFVCGFILKKM